MATATKEAPKKEVKKASTPETKGAKETKKEKAPEKKYVTTREIATSLGVKPATLRRYLRTLPKFQDSGYTRYKWDPDSKEDMQNVEDIKTSFKKHAEKEAKDKNAKKAEKAEAKKAEKASAPAEGSEDDDLVEDEDNEEEDEESLE